MRWFDDWSGRTDRLAAIEEAVETGKKALQLEVDNNRSLEAKIFQLEHSLEIERTKRIAAESIAVERKSEIERFLEELRSSRKDLRTLQGERLRSLDALNLKLVSPSLDDSAEVARFRAQRERKEPVEMHQVPQGVPSSGSPFSRARSDSRTMDLKLLEILEASSRKGKESA